MIIVRYLLFPFAIVYDFITTIRNFLYDKGILKSYSFDLPVIVVGNLSVGGTGKTPQIEYLIRLLSDKYKVATLSRGYKRKSKGFILANSNANAEILGDEPFQFYKKFPFIQVAVDADRKNGIEHLLSQDEKPEIILLDDAYQHRKVKAGFYILLTSFDDLFTDDYLLPTGTLRESRNGVKRADVIIVTKCPKHLSENDRAKIKFKLAIQSPLFFSYIEYDDTIISNAKQLSVSDIKNIPKLLVAGIAKPKDFFSYLQGKNDDVSVYSDHHNFSDADIIEINNKAKNNLIITTEKDYVRLNDKLKNDNLFYLPIKSSFIMDGDNFDKTILNYVGTSTRNR